MAFNLTGLLTNSRPACNAFHRWACRRDHILSENRGHRRRSFSSGLLTLAVSRFSLISRRTSCTLRLIPNTRSRSRGAMRPSCVQIFRPLEGGGNAGCPLHPRPRVHFAFGKKHTSIRVHRNRPAFPHAMVLTVYSALSPVTGLFCHRRLAD